MRMWMGWIVCMLCVHVQCNERRQQQLSRHTLFRIDWWVREPKCADATLSRALSLLALLPLLLKTNLHISVIDDASRFGHFFGDSICDIVDCFFPSKCSCRRLQWMRNYSQILQYVDIALWAGHTMYKYLVSTLNRPIVFVWQRRARERKRGFDSLSVALHIHTNFQPLHTYVCVLHMHCNTLFCQFRTFSAYSDY